MLFGDVIRRLFSADPRTSVAPEYPFLDAALPAIPKDLVALIQRTESRKLFQDQASGGAFWAETLIRVPALEPVLREALVGATVLDLGAGPKWRDMYELCRRQGARQYVAIDRFMYRGRGEVCHGVRLVERQDAEDCGFVVLDGDMLTLLSQTRTASCAVTMNSIDRAIIENPQYHSAVAQEIERVVAPERAAFGTICEALSRLSAGTSIPPAQDFSRTPNATAQIINDAEGMSAMLVPRGLNPKWIEHAPPSLPYERLLVRKS